MRREWVDTIMEVFNIRRIRGVSHIEKVLLHLEPGDCFTVKELVTRTKITIRYIYKVLEKYPMFFEKQPPHTYPEDYQDYSIKRKRRYREENGLPAKGRQPPTYLFTGETTPLIDHIIDQAIEKTGRLRELQQTPSPQIKELEAVH